MFNALLCEGVAVDNRSVDLGSEHFDRTERRTTNSDFRDLALNHHLRSLSDNQKKAQKSCGVDVLEVLDG